MTIFFHLFIFYNDLLFLWESFNQVDFWCNPYFAECFPFMCLLWSSSFPVVWTLFLHPLSIQLPALFWRSAPLLAFGVLTSLLCFFLHLFLIYPSLFSQSFSGCCPFNSVLFQSFLVSAAGSWYFGFLFRFCQLLTHFSAIKELNFATLSYLINLNTLSRTALTFTGIFGESYLASRRLMQ